jgi:hypothetical protein
MRNWWLILICLGLAIASQVSFGPTPKVTGNMYPKTHFLRAPHLARFEIVREGVVLRRETIRNGRSEDGQTLRVSLGVARLTGRDSTLSCAFVQDGELSFSIPVDFSIDGKTAGESTVLTPIPDDFVEVTIRLRRYGLYLRAPAGETFEAQLIDAVAEGVRARAENGNNQTEIKRLHGVSPR